MLLGQVHDANHAGATAISIYRRHLRPFFAVVRDMYLLFGVPLLDLLIILSGSRRGCSMILSKLMATQAIARVQASLLRVLVHRSKFGATQQRCAKHDEILHGHAHINVPLLILVTPTSVTHRTFKLTIKNSEYLLEIKAIH